MTRFFLPLILIVVALAIFFGFTSELLYAPLEINPNTQKISGGLVPLLTERSALKSALAVSFDLQQESKDLVDSYNNLDSADRDRVERLLPDHIDTVQLVIDVNSIASRYGMTIQDIDIKTEDTTRRAVASRQSEVATKPEKNAVISFSASGSYDALQNFLTDLAKSLRLVDVRALSFTAGENDFYRYNFELQTYWLP